MSRRAILPNGDVVIYDEDTEQWVLMVARIFDVPPDLLRPAEAKDWRWATPPCPTCGEHPGTCGHKVTQ